MKPEEGLASVDLKFVLEGEHLHGSWVLVRIKNWSSGTRINWLLIKHRDEYAHESNGDALLADDRSVASGRPMADIAAGKGPAPTPFMMTDVSGPAPAFRPERKTAAGYERKLKARAQVKNAADLPQFIEPQL